MSDAPSPAQTLRAGGPRTAVTEEEARSIGNRFGEELNASTTTTTVITTVDLSCRAWTRCSLECLRSTLEQAAPTVTCLKLDDVIASLPTEQGLDSLGFFSEIFRNSQIEELDFNDNALGSRGDQVLSPLFGLPSLRRLSIENCGMSKEVASSLLQSLHSPYRLTHLSLGRNQIGAEGAKHVGTLLAACPTLQVFNYNGARPLKEGTAYILQGLAQMAEDGTQLTHLNLHDCTIGSDDDDDSPLQNLVKVLSKSPQLTVLNLQDGEVGAGGLQAVLNALKESNIKLSKLSLGACELGQDGAEAMAENAQVLAHLTELTLDTNELGDEGVATLLPVLAAECTSLLKLDLECNEIAKSGAKALLNNPLTALKELNLSDNPEIPAKLALNLKQKYSAVHVDDDLEEDENDDEEDDQAVDELAAKMADANI